MLGSWCRVRREEGGWRRNRSETKTSDEVKIWESEGGLGPGLVWSWHPLLLALLAHPVARKENKNQPGRVVAKCYPEQSCAWPLHPAQLSDSPTREL